jgi:hypothetical protein
MATLESWRGLAGAAGGVAPGCYFVSLLESSMNSATAWRL